MPRQQRTRPVSASQTRRYLTKAEEYVAAAQAELAADRPIAATSLAIHAAINAADAVTGVRVGTRAAGQDYDEVLALLRSAGADGAAVAKDLTRLLPLKTRAEYEPDDISTLTAAKAVERAGRCVAVGRRVVSAQAR